MNIKRTYDKMRMFEGLFDKLIAGFSDWIQVRDDNCPWTIEDFPYETGVIEEMVEPHCVKCVAVNKCWFKNEINKKPEEFNYNSYTFEVLSKLKGNHGLYHPNCHCEKHAIKAPNKNDVKIIKLDEKMEYAIKDKENWFKNMGYSVQDKTEISDLIDLLSKEEYCEGNYEMVRVSEKFLKYGFKINIFIPFKGKNEKSGKIYNLKSCYMIFPNGKLKNNTPIGGWAK